MIPSHLHLMDHFSPHGTSHSSAYKPCFSSLLLHNRPSPNSVALNNSLLLSLVVLVVLELTVPVSHLDSPVHLRSEGRWGWSHLTLRLKLANEDGFITHTPGASDGGNNYRVLRNLSLPAASPHG